MKKLPHYKIEFITGKAESIVCSYVDLPATEENFMTFSKNSFVQFRAIDKVRRLVMGVMMIPDTPIYRNDESGEYTVEFSKDAIENYIKEWAKAGRQNKISFRHSGNLVTDVFLTESFIIDSRRGISTPKAFGKTYPDGTWICTHWFEDQKLYDELISSGELKGFSIEGLFKINPSQFKNQQMNIIPIKIESLAKINFLAQKKNKGAEIYTAQNFKRSNSLKKSNWKFVKAKAKDGTVLELESKIPNVGETIFVIPADGSEKLPPANGVIEMSDGSQIDVMNGMITAIKPAEKAPVAPQKMSMHDWRKIYMK